MKIGFIGLGHMGSPMASNLLKAGHQLTVFDLSETAMAHLQQLGAQTAASISDVAKTNDLDILITMLPAGSHVRQVYMGDDGVLKHIAPHVLLIDCSTIDPHTALSLIHI